MVLGGMKAAFVPSPSLGPWHARRLDSADVDSRAWLASTRTCIAFAVPFIVFSPEAAARHSQLARAHTDSNPL